MVISAKEAKAKGKEIVLTKLEERIDLALIKQFHKETIKLVVYPSDVPGLTDDDFKELLVRYDGYETKFYTEQVKYVSVGGCTPTLRTEIYFEFKCK